MVARRRAGVNRQAEAAAPSGKAPPASLEALVALVQAAMASMKAAVASAEAEGALARAAVPSPEALGALVEAATASVKALSAFLKALVALAGGGVPPARAVPACAEASGAFPPREPRARPRQGQLGSAGAPAALFGAGPAAVAFDLDRERPRIGRTR